MSLGPQIPGALVGSGNPIGAASGDLAGTYPGPTVGDLSLSGEARGGVAVRGATVWAPLALGGAGTLLRSDGTDLVYTTLTIPTTIAAGALLYGTATNALGPLAIGTGLQVLRVNAAATALEYAAATPLTTRGDLIRAGAAGAPERVALGATAGMFLRSDATDAVWSTLVLPNGATAGDVPVATAANTVTMLAKGASLQVLRMNVGATTQEYATLAAADVGAVALGTAGHPGATGAFTTARPTLTSGTTTVTLTGASAAGQVFYATSTVGTYGLARADAVATARGGGVYDGVAATLVTGGVVGVLFEAGLTSLTAGDPVYLSVATAGRATKTAPVVAGQSVTELGTLLDSTSYDNGAGSVHAVLWQPQTPVLL